MIYEMIYAALICLLIAPRAKWVNRLLPNTANRVLFLSIVSVLILSSLVQEIDAIRDHGVNGESYFVFASCLVFVGALYRAVYEWWFRVPQPADSTDRPS